MRSMSAERDLAEELVRQQDRIVNLGMAEAVRIGESAQRLALRAWRKGHSDPAEVFRLKLMDVVPTLRDAMITAYLKGRLVIPTGLKLSEPQTVFGKSKQALERQLELQDQVIAHVAATYHAEAVTVFEQTGMLAAANVTEVMAAIHAEGLHVREAKKRLIDSFIGFTKANAYVAERVFRTQIQIAYGAGRWMANQEKEVDEILWGYVYVTAHDSRVRPKHQGLDGTRLPKNDPFWKTSYPPNGINCRCQALEIFKGDEPDKPVRPPSVFETIQGAKRVQIGKGKNAVFMQTGGKKVRVKPGPDEGFAYNPGIALAV